MNHRTLARLALLVALATAISAAYLYRDQINTAVLEEWIKNAGVFGPLLYMAIYAFATVLFLPGSLLTLAGGALFGPVWGTLYSLSGATLGATAAFLMARYLNQDWVRQRTGSILNKLLDGVASEGWKFVAFVRLVPLFPFNLLNYALGLTRLGLATYVVASFIFMLPGALAYTYLGYAGREALAGGEGMIQKVVLALALLTAVAYLPRLVKRFRGAADGKLASTELKTRLEHGDDITVLDVRPAKDYIGELGHITGSLNIPVDELPTRLPELNVYRDRPLAVICRTNRMSGKAIEQLRAAGFKQALLVTDGMVGWQQLHGKSAPVSSENNCSTSAVPGGISAGTGKTVTVIIQNAPYKGNNKAWHALRFAGAALTEDMEVRVHLLDECVHLARAHQVVPEGAVDLGKLLEELMECGLEVRACGMSLNELHITENDLLPGIQPGSMKGLASWVQESDIVLTF